jgi:hypothetical protein
MPDNPKEEMPDKPRCRSRNPQTSLRERAGFALGHGSRRWGRRGWPWRSTPLQNSSFDSGMQRQRSSNTKRLAMLHPGKRNGWYSLFEVVVKAAY